MKHDLLHYYLKKEKALDPLGTTFKTRWKQWEDAWRNRSAPPDKPPANRREVYDLLVSSPEGTPADELLSRIPWNQLAYGWKIHFANAERAKQRKMTSEQRERRGDPDKKHRKMCSEVIRFFFDRYMVLERRNPKREALLKDDSNDFDDAKARRACKLLADRLKAHKPTSIAICWPEPLTPKSQRRKRLEPAYIKKYGWPHVLGVVACDTTGRNFLALEPWPGNATGAKYGSIRTSFLAVIKYNPAKGALEYANGVSGIKGSCVLAVNAF
ncbi:MAG: hypothetical protein JSV91_12495 [Phycisphaerales bacterium]|nr:MAG: hypothetical protein JSV91_12495 [Phycisphaerales bacterium]